MSILNLEKFSSPVLRNDMQKIDGITDEIRTLVDDMKESMYAHNGVGLAAPQVGHAVQITGMAPSWSA